MRNIQLKDIGPWEVLSTALPLLLLCFLNACANTNTAGTSNVIVVKNVNLIAMESDQVQPNKCIVIKDKIIDYVGPIEKAKYPKHASIIDAEERYAIPGLCDMHIHIDHPDILKLNLVQGVTTVMNYRGLPEHLILRDQSEENNIISPNIYTTGDYMEGYPATVPGFLSFDNADDARESVRTQKKDGYDFIKVYRNLDSLMHLAICDEAAKNELTVVGHLSPDISLQQSLAAGQKVIAHTEELMYFFNNENDTSRIKDLVDLLKTYDIVYTPNLGIFRSLFLQVENLDSLNSQPYLKYLQPAIYQSWREEYNYNHRRGEEWAGFMRDRFDFLQKVSQEIKNADIQILTSTDAPTSGAIPGIAVHNELREFVEIGFTPYEALRTATVEPGIFIKKHIKNSLDFGLIKKGYRADFLLLDANPLEHIENTRTIWSVFKNGIWYSKDYLQNKLNALPYVYQKVDSIVRSIEKEVSDENVDKAYELYTQAKAKYKDQLFLGYYTMWYAGYQFLYENRELTQDPNRADLAIQFYKMYLNDYPNLHGSHYLLGMAYKAKGDTTMAVKSFKESLNLHPYNPYAIRRLNEFGVSADK